jgi:hypothetical protein
MATQTYLMQVLTSDGNAQTVTFKLNGIFTPYDALIGEIEAVKAWLPGAPVLVDTRVVLADLGVVWTDWLLPESEARWDALA